MMTEEVRPVNHRAAAVGVGVLLALHVVLAILYANLTPYRTPGYLFVTRSRPWSPVPDIGAPDERQHVNYVLELLAGRGLPVYRVNVPDPANPGKLTRNPNLEEVYEFHQPPLFYVLDAGFGRLMGVDEVSGQDSHVGVRLRYLNSVFGALTILGIYALGVWGVRSRSVALLAAAIAGLLPMNLALSGAVSNDPLLFAICTWTLAICALSLREGWTFKRSVLVGFLVGMGLLTKATALLLIPVVAVSFLLTRPRAGSAIASAVVALLLALPLWLRNQQLYGDPLGLTAFQELFAAAPKAGDLVAAFGPFGYWINFVGWWTARSFFGVFGYMDIFLNGPGYADSEGPNTLYRFLLAGALVACAGFFLALRRVTDPAERKVHWVGATLFCLVTLMFLRYNYSFFQGQARYFFPALGPISIGLAMGVLYLAGARRRATIVALTAGLLVLNLFALSRLPVEFQKRLNPPTNFPAS